MPRYFRHDADGAACAGGRERCHVGARRYMAMPARRGRAMMMGDTDCAAPRYLFQMGAPAHVSEGHEGVGGAYHARRRR